MDGLANLHPAFAHRLVLLAMRCDITITSGYRSPERQRQLYEDYLAGRGNPANPPGTSNHEIGVAADLGGDLACAHSHARELALHFPISGEPWHVQMVEATGPRINPHDHFPPIHRGDDLMGCYTVPLEPGVPTNVPLPPPGDGASGGGYEDPVYVSVSTPSPTTVHERLLDGGGGVIEDRDWALVEGRKVIAVARKGTNSVTLTPKSDAPKTVVAFIEWGRPEET